MSGIKARQRRSLSDPAMQVALRAVVRRDAVAQRPPIKESQAEVAVKAPCRVQLLVPNALDAPVAVVPEPLRAPAVV